MTAHGLRGTVVTMFFEAGFSDANFAMRAGHQDLRSLKNYHNLRSDLGKMQQDANFSEERPLKKSKMQEDLLSDEDVEICPNPEDGQGQVGRAVSKVSRKDDIDDIEEASGKLVEGGGLGRGAASSSSVSAENGREASRAVFEIVK